MKGVLPRVAVLGRQNVGKSTLVNRLVGQREAIAHSSPGVTRDRVELEATWRGRRFLLIDTGGYLHAAKGIEALVRAQADRAASEADVILLVVDARSGITEEDAALARRLRKVAEPVLVVANKVDTAQEEVDALTFRALGLGEAVGVSAALGRSSGDLLDRIVELLPDAGVEAEEPPAEPRFALVGRPNVGKSSLFNRILSQERSVVYEEAGTTRDSVDAMIEWPMGTVRFVDTAGMRRPTRVHGVEYYSFVRATQAIERADVAILVVDALEGFTAEDKRIAVRVIEAGRGFLVVANKWDLIEDKDRTYKLMAEEVSLFAKASLVRTSALSGQGVPRLPHMLMDLHARWNSRATTSKVNEVLIRAVTEQPAPRGAGKIHYATQVSSGPPSFVLFGGATPGATYQRYLENRLRAAFDLDGVPIRMKFRLRRRKTPASP